MKNNPSILIFIPIFLLGFSSCDKEKFPKEKNLIGHWVEKTPDSAKKEMTFYKGNTVYYINPWNTTSTYRYELDKSSKNLRLIYDIESTFHNIKWNKKKDELTILGLNPGPPEIVSETRFEKN